MSDPLIRLLELLIFFRNGFTRHRIELHGIYSRAQTSYAVDRINADEGNIRVLSQSH